MVTSGLSGAYNGGSLTVKVTIATFLGVACYNAIELCILIFVTFNRYRGLYFWSLLVAGIIGVVPYSIGYLIKFYDLIDSVWLSVTLITIGWWSMVTGQSVVLYSRLHLVQRDRVILRRVLALIIVNAIIFHIPTTVLTFGSNSESNHEFITAYSIMEKVQMTGFCVQELLLSTLYIVEAVKILRSSSDKGSRRIIYQLLGINFIFILMDIGLLTAAYANFYVIETTLKAMIYSVKLKLEFAVLGKLVRIVHSHSWNPEFNHGSDGLPDFVNGSLLTTDVTRAPMSGNGPPKPPWVLTDGSDRLDEELAYRRNRSQSSPSLHTMTSKNSVAVWRRPVSTDGIPGVLPSPTNSKSTNSSWLLP
ncbi:hypothetical protein LOZ12_005253 [Ophidiomyces ophidiicola]|uniref:Uncharacterized protein n=1 Tax=Ophidiomyces ophidiicola TaxID=1387563 RepID=A0ACB8UZU2_9EURO|nr:uncharacterized protein LOZ57_002312 [Ophidiomyces ophidiicola]KAI1936962.1 hypothetical protein LOZ62_005613 [Ophidiomyces ophidiicola]KAI1949834.1 hypothetical protein LOZ57_002312 [Ophidiomyces ophidiicola]KAI1952118.1 hypothetical protein LOZ59_005515 [Ophidiomyces ophidiicola]KAI1971929.1 hypothetical protein LOZ56_002776 [Ophidiomyces ophidiicola]KAI2019033.1 hypothetical protein LOZ46_003556 [Ophidiomyces ophidiicola]